MNRVDVEGVDKCNWVWGEVREDVERAMGGGRVYGVNVEGVGKCVGVWGR